MRRAQVWAAGVLGLATLVLLAYLVALVALASVVGFALDAVRGTDTLSVDLSLVAVDVLPGLLVGWCVGLATTTLLARGEAMGPRAAGLLSGTIGAVAGATVLTVTGIL